MNFDNILWDWVKHNAIWFVAPSEYLFNAFDWYVISERLMNEYMQDLRYNDCCGPQLTTLLHDRLWIGLDWLPEVDRWLLNEYMQDLQWFAVDQQLIMGPFRPEDLPVESLRISPLNAKIKKFIEITQCPKKWVTYTLMNEWVNQCLEWLTIDNAFI